MRMLRRSAALMLACVAATATFARADSLEYASDSAAVVIKFNDLSSVSQKIGRYARELGATMISPNLADPLASFTEEMGIKGGLNEKGDAAVVVFAPSEDVKEGDNAVILLPVSDYAAFVASWPKVNEEGAVTEVTLPNSSGTGFVTNWGNYAALAKNKSLITNKPDTAITVPAKSAAALKEQDMVMFANIEAVAILIQPELAKGRTEAQDKLKDDEKVPAEYKPVLSAAAHKLFDVADAFFRDTDGAIVGVTFGEEGISTHVLAEFKESSYIGGFTGKLTQTNKPLLAGLPETGYLFTAGIVNSKPMSDAIFADIVDPVVEQLPPEEKLAFVKGYVAEVKALSGKTDTVSYGVHTPTGTIGVDPLLQLSLVAHGDGNAIKQSFTKLNEYGQQFAELMMAASGEGDVKIVSKTTAGAKEVAGVSFDEVEVSIAGDGPQANQQRQAFKMMYGSESQKTYVGATDKATLVCMGITDDQVGALVAAAKAGDAPVSALAHVASVTKALPAERSLEVYVHLDQIAGVALRTAQTFGAVRNPPAIPANLEPLGFSLGGEKGSIHIDGYLPLNTLKAMVSVGLQTAGEMRGGGGGGGGGL
jgi:hypothetical protein